MTTIRLLLIFGPIIELFVFASTDVVAASPTNLAEISHTRKPCDGARDCDAAVEGTRDAPVEESLGVACWRFSRGIRDSRLSDLYSLRNVPGSIRLEGFSLKPDSAWETPVKIVETSEYECAIMAGNVLDLLTRFAIDMEIACRQCELAASLPKQLSDVHVLAMWRLRDSLREAILDACRAGWRRVPKGHPGFSR